MKFLLSAITATAVVFSPSSVIGEGNLHCTRGRLFVSDAASGKLQVFELDGTDSPIAMNETLTVLGGLPAPRMYASATDSTVIVISMGNEANNWKDGHVGFVLTGVTPTAHEVDGFFVMKSNPFVSSSSVLCTRPIHHIANGEKISIFCDGAFDVGENSTIFTLNENLIRQGDPDAVEFSKTLEGSHHGVAVPTTDGHILTSLATRERILRDPNATSLPR